MPREFDAAMGRGPYECDCGAEGVAAPLEPTPQIDDAFVEQIEDALGMGHGAWDMVDPVEICKAVAAAVSKNLTDKYAEMEAKWMRELLTVSDEIGEARDRISDLLDHDGGPGSIDYDAVKVFRARAKLLEFREITALREKP